MFIKQKLKLSRPTPENSRNSRGTLFFPLQQTRRSPTFHLAVLHRNSLTCSSSVCPILYVDLVSAKRMSSPALNLYIALWQRNSLIKNTMPNWWLIFLILHTPTYRHIDQRLPIVGNTESWRTWRRNKTSWFYNRTRAMVLWSWIELHMTMVFFRSSMTLLNLDLLLKEDPTLMGWQWALPLPRCWLIFSWATMTGFGWKTIRPPVFYFTDVMLTILFVYLTLNVTLLCFLTTSMTHIPTYVSPWKKRWIKNPLLGCSDWQQSAAISYYQGLS